MNIRPILSALARNKTGAVLIALQIAVTLAVVCNSLFVIQQRVNLISRPTGMVETNLLTLNNQWIVDGDDLPARTEADLATLRRLPGVIDAYSANAFPLRGGGFTADIGLKPDQATETQTAVKIFGDVHALPTLGLKLTEGRNFSSDEIGDANDSESPTPAVIIITQAMARELFAGQPAVGKVIYLDNRPSTIVGVAERLQSPFAASSWARSFAENTVLEPYRYHGSFSTLMIRTDPGQMETVAEAAKRALLELDRGRVLDAAKPFPEIRARAYRNDQGLVIILAVISLILIGVTALGIVGLTSFWVTQRQRQIGVRRALGASRRAIIRHFQTENLLIVTAGALLGCVLTVGLNVLMIKNFSMPALPVPRVLAGAALILLIGQLSVLWPALRAASVPPALATRSV